MTRRIWCALIVVLACATRVMAQDVSLIKEIDVRGSVNVNKDTILAAMRTKVGQPYVQAQLDQDKRSIEEIGFFSAVDVRAREIGDGNWQVVVEVVEFPKIKEIRIAGNGPLSQQEILDTMAKAPGHPIAPGNVFNYKSIAPASKAIEKLYADKGYFARVDAPTGPLPDSPETINVTLLVLKVNTVSVQGATRTKKFVLDRLIKTRPDSYLHIPTWRQDLGRLINTQWFEKVDSIENPTEDPAKIDLIADVKEARTGIFNIGLQVDPRNSVAGLLSLRDTNFRGTGQTVGVGLLQGTSGGGTSIDLDYGNPFVDNRDTSINASIYSRVIYRFSGIGFGGDDTPTLDDQFTERRTGLAVSAGRPFRRTYYGSVGLKFENIITGNLDTDQETGFIQQDGNVATLSLGVANDRRDVAVDPSEGSYMRLMVEPGYSNITQIGGDAPDPGILGVHTFLRSTFEWRGYWSPQPSRQLKLEEPRRVFALRVRVGQISGKVPFFEQFFVGGSDSLRGYPEDRFWGTNMAVASLEYRHPIQKSFNAILFADYGGAWGGYGTVNRYTQTKSSSFHLGYGIGFSFRTPLGPIRLDFGFNEDGSSRTHFVIGTSF